MSIEDKLDRQAEKLDRFIEESSRYQGEAREYMKQTTNYIKAVSDNVKDTKKDLKEHLENNDAHALGVREKGGDKWVAWLALGAAVIATCKDFIHK